MLTKARFRAWVVAGSRRHEWLLFALGFVVSLPMLVYGFPHPTHDGFCHLRWWSEFAGQFWIGTLYPRWLADINYGYGSPTFFYYPPLPYWVSALVAPFAGHEIPGWRALGWASSLGLLLSGQTALACFRKLTSPDRAFVVAALYMLMPYHLAIDLLERGAYAEFWAFVWMPMVLAGVIGQRKKEPRAWLKTGGGFALLFLTHLPTAVTFTPFVLAYALCCGMRTFFGACGAVVVGCGLAAVYLVPALTMQEAVSTQYLRFPYESAFFFPSLELDVPLSKADEFNLRLMWVFGLLAMALICFYILAMTQKSGRALQRERLIWLGLGFGVLVMMVPFSDFLYRLFPSLQMIQFPWRFLAPGSLVLAVLMAVFWPEGSSRLPARVVHGAVMAAIGVISIRMTWAAYQRTCLRLEVREGMAPALVNATEEDVPEYRPVQSNLATAREQLGNAAAKVVDGIARVLVLEWKPRLLRLEVNATTGGQVVLRQFYYPGWTARTDQGLALCVAPDAQTGLLRVRFPIGRHAVTVQLVAGIAEKVGWGISLFTIVGCLIQWYADRGREAAKL